MFYDKILFGKEIKTLRIDRGYKQSEVSSYLNITQSYYSQIENGYKDISVDMLIGLSVLYHVSIDVLLYKSIIKK